jgi:hypothetical protein
MGDPIELGSQYRWYGAAECERRLARDVDIANVETRLREPVEERLVTFRGTEPGGLEKEPPSLGE